MSHSNLDHLITMVNQIAMNMQHGCGSEEAVKKVAQHLTLFWAPSMREQIIAASGTHKAQLEPIAYAAVKAIS